MKPMKKLLCILLIFTLLFGITASAEENETPPEMPSGQMAPPDSEDGTPPTPPDGSMTPPDGGNGTPRLLPTVV